MLHSRWGPGPDALARLGINDSRAGSENLGRALGPLRDSQWLADPGSPIDARTEWRGFTQANSFPLSPRYRRSALEVSAPGKRCGDLERLPRAIFRGTDRHLGPVSRRTRVGADMMLCSEPKGSEGAVSYPAAEDARARF